VTPVPPLLIVSRGRPDLLSRFQEAFADFRDLEVVLDRRARASRAGDERRRWDIEAALRAYGWALVGEKGARPAARPAGTRRVLVADDHEDTRHLLEWVLRRAGLEVAHAEDGEVAVISAQTWHPDLAIVDMFMPHKDGAEVIRELRQRPRSPKILAITAGWRAGGIRVAGNPNDFDVLDDAVAAGADAVMTKPIDPRELLQVVRKLLES
jgi:CheY-like chemotaxis protein